MHQRTRLILRDEADRNSLSRLVYRSNWTLHERVQADPETDTPFEVVYSTEDETVGIHYLEDHAVGLRYVLIQGDEIDPVVAAIERVMPTYTIDEIEARWGTVSTSSELATTVLMFGVACAGPASARGLRFFERALQHPDEDVRFETVVAMAYAGWPELQPILERTIGTDPASHVREQAQVLLDGIAQLNP